MCYQEFFKGLKILKNMPQKLPHLLRPNGPIFARKSPQQVSRSDRSRIPESPVQPDDEKFALWNHIPQDNHSVPHQGLLVR